MPATAAPWKRSGNRSDGGAGPRTRRTPERPRSAISGGLAEHRSCPMPAVRQPSKQGRTDEPRPAGRHLPYAPAPPADVSPQPEPGPGSPTFVARSRITPRDQPPARRTLGRDSRTGRLPSPPAACARSAPTPRSASSGPACPDRTMARVSGQSGPPVRGAGQCSRRKERKESPPCHCASQLLTPRDLTT